MSTKEINHEDKSAKKESKSKEGFQVTEAVIFLGILTFLISLGLLAWNFVEVPSQNAKIQSKTDQIHEQLVAVGDNPTLTDKDELIAKIQIDSNLSASTKLSYKISYENNDDNYTFCVEGYRTESNEKVAESGTCPLA